MAKFKKGQSGNPNGRRRGAKNKITKDLKTAYIEAFERRGGVQGLLDWAEKSPDAFYGQISKMLPKNVELKTSEDFAIIIKSAIPEPKPKPLPYHNETRAISPKCSQKKDVGI